MDTYSLIVRFIKTLGWLALVVLVILKLTSKIETSWLWVTFPVWGVWTVGLLLVALGQGLLVFTRIFESKQDKKIRELQDSIQNYSDRIGRM